MTHSKTEVCDECYGETRREEKMDRDGALLCAARAENAELKAKLAIATEALKRITHTQAAGGRLPYVMVCGEFQCWARAALKQIEETK